MTVRLSPLELTDALALLKERARPSVPLSDMGLFGLAMRVNPKFEAKVDGLLAATQVTGVW